MSTTGKDAATTAAPSVEETAQFIEKEVIPGTSIAPYQDAYRKEFAQAVAKKVIESDGYFYDFNEEVNKIGGKVGLDPLPHKDVLKIARALEEKGFIEEGIVNKLGTKYFEAYSGANQAWLEQQRIAELALQDRLITLATYAHHATNQKVRDNANVELAAEIDRIKAGPQILEELMASGTIDISDFFGHRSKAAASRGSGGTGRSGGK